MYLSIPRSQQCSKFTLKLFLNYIPPNQQTVKDAVWRRKWQPAPEFLSREFRGQRSLVGCGLWGRIESDTTEVTQHACMHWRRKWQPTPVFLPGESQGHRNLVGCGQWGHTESDMTEATQQQQQKRLLFIYLFIYLFIFNLFLLVGGSLLYSIVVFFVIQMANNECSVQSYYDMRVSRVYFMQSTYTLHRVHILYIQYYLQGT